MTLYLDSSALVKLVVEEPESAALRTFLLTHPERASCTLARVEVVRAVRAEGVAARDRALTLLERLRLLRMDDPLLADASRLADEVLCSLDAIHLAAARALEDDLEAIVTYDRRMDEAADALGLPVTAPGSR